MELPLESQRDQSVLLQCRTGRQGRARAAGVDGGHLVKVLFRDAAAHADVTLRRQILEELEERDTFRSVRRPACVCVCVCVHTHVLRERVSVAAQPPLEAATAKHEHVNYEGRQDGGQRHQQHHRQDPRLLGLFCRKQKPSQRPDGTGQVSRGGRAYWTG